MKRNTLSLSLLLSTALVVPTLAMADLTGYEETTPADTSTATADNTLQAEVEGPDGELLATQPGEVVTDETVVETYPEEVSPDAQNEALNQQDSSEIDPAVTEPTDVDYNTMPVEPEEPLANDEL
ncbi:hypothetical protein [uncultured Psychrobacter sp.]|uniref:hypothetical protein n=1 Tax=uncultured Psychrobacter sp. TaxID=259303 RepID=UPI003457BB7D